MKTVYPYTAIIPLHRSFLLLLLLFSLNSNAQLFPVGQAAQFGIDGDLRSDERLNGTFTAAGSHDWFRKDNGTGIGIFDTLGKTFYNSQISTGKNISFSKDIQYPSYSTQSNLLMLDGAYSRDDFGLGTTSATSDKTIFSTSGSGNRNYADPSTWTTVPTGNSVPAKADIIDAFIHMRRNGTSIQIGNPSNLIIYFAASTLGTEGERYIDFELHKNALVYNTSTGIFSGGGASTTGGRDIWEFNTDGSLKAFGGFTVSFSFSNSQVTDISIYIWVPYVTFTTVIPSTFDFVSGSWSGATTGGFGWAKIKAKNGAALPAYGAVNTSTTIGPIWGTSSKDLGTMAGGTNYYSANYATGQFAEAAIDLTALGVDPALATAFDKCTPPYRRVLVKSRSSSSFSSALQDFVGPLEFLDAPTVPATIANVSSITCAEPTQTLLPASNITGAEYIWSTAGGNVINSQTSSSATISEPGKYKLTASLYSGCTPTTDSIIVQKDVYQPIASADASGILRPNETVTLIGGDAQASSYNTEFGTSQGLSWKWTGPSGFMSNMQNVQTSTAGTYNLVVTETRNGCTAAATVTVLSAPDGILTVKFMNFKIQENKQQRTNTLLWKIADANVANYFVIEKSYNGATFNNAGYVFSSTDVEYMFKDADAVNVVYYRIKGISKDGSVTFSSILKSETGTSGTEPFKAHVDASKNIIISYNSEVPQTISLRLVNMNGQILHASTKNVEAGPNIFRLTNARKSNGVYLLNIENKSQSSSVKIKL